jgi:hypothetical protein
MALVITGQFSTRIRELISPILNAHIPASAALRAPGSVEETEI